MGIDIGGTGIKAAIVDVSQGELNSERVRLKTPRPATPEAVVKTAAKLQRQLAWEGVVGCGFPGQVKQGIVTEAPNLNPAWEQYDLGTKLGEGALGKSVALLNDADAAGLAEIEFGAGKDHRGTVVVITLGTGIGTAVFHQGHLLPNTELGHVELDGQDSESIASEGARIRNEWSWRRWAGHLDRYLAHLEYLLGVDLFVLGGGASKKAHKFLPHLLSVRCEIVPAKMGNLAGIVGAAMYAARQFGAQGAE